MVKREIFDAVYIQEPMKIFLPLLLVPALAGSAHPPLKPVHWAIVGGSAPHTVIAGKPTEVVLAADIAEGWYIYSLTQKPGGPFPLRIQLANAADVGLLGPIKAPKPFTKFDPNFGIETELHRGKPRFTLPLGVPARSRTGRRELTITARYQACSETLCLPPRTEKIPLKLSIKRSP
ncbi:MAG TPA: protein-disulfide reductase DsbD N-terminal domain-containing protein [Gemmatimonadaceae bacterium]|nr:protein-disulfide reductase DsbD N-terminal domain-containing protein [Gemmatimonadaceae bacterium]